MGEMHKAVMTVPLEPGLEVIADLDPTTPAELVVDGIEIELRVLPDGK